MTNPYFSYEKYGNIKDRMLPNQSPYLRPVCSPLSLELKVREPSVVNLTSMPADNTGIISTASEERNREPSSYKRDAFQIIGSELAEDPLKIVRTMRNRLSQVAINSAGSDRRIKVELSQSASDLLTKAELQLVQLKRKRLDALSNGESKIAEQLTTQMKELSQQCIFNTYADLLLDGEETNVFGKHSMWIPRKKHNKRFSRNKNSSHHRSHKKGTCLDERRERVELPQRSSRSSTPHQWDTSSNWIPLARENNSSSSLKHHSLIDIWREGSGRRLRSPPFRPVSRTPNTVSVEPSKGLPQISRRPSQDQWVFDKRNESLQAKRRSSSEHKRATIKPFKRRVFQCTGRKTTFCLPKAELKFKKNDRLSLRDDGSQRPRFGEHLDAMKEGVISSAAICPYCISRDPGFVNPEYLKQHMAEKCNPLTKCEFCDKIVETSQLNDHHLDRCSFVEDTLKPCADCGLARYPGKERHPKCRGKKPPDGAAWCPQCTSKVEAANSRNAWQNHLATACYNNPRNGHWPQPNINDLDEIRGDDLLASLYDENVNSLHERNQKANHRGRPKGGNTQQRQQLQQPTIDIEQMRTAMKKLNHEQRINRARGIAAETAHRHANDEDDDPIGH